VPAEALYRDAVRALVATLEGANIEAARAAVRSIVGTVPMFEQAGELWGRIGMSGAALLRVAGIERAGSGGPQDGNFGPPLVVVPGLRRRVAALAASQKFLPMREEPLG